MGKSDISWTDATWSPVRGCTPASAGCAHCWAVRTVWRLAHSPCSAVREKCSPLVERNDSGEAADTKARWTGRVHLDHDALAAPLHWRRPRRIFVAPQGDLFHPEVPDEFIAAVFGVMAACPQHTFQVLTKRADRMRQWFAWYEGTSGAGADATAAMFQASDMIDEDPPKRFQEELIGEVPDAWPLPNVHLGVTAENQAAAVERVLHLLETPAAVRFVSYEPALGPLDLRRIELIAPKPPFGPGVYLDALTGHVAGPDDMLGARVNWVIAGGESGAGARLCDVAWIRSVVEQCKAARTSVFVKQMGAFAHDRTRDPGGLCAETRIGKHGKPNADPAEWPESLRVREYPEVRHG